MGLGFLLVTPSLETRVKRFVIVTLLAVFGTLPRPAAATLLQQCCACVESPNAQTSGFPGPSSQVFFCAEADTGGIPGLETRCEDVSRGQGALACEANIPGPSCRAQLAEAGIACPAAGAPAASPVGLASLIAILAMLGAVGVRRRWRLLGMEDRS